MVAHPAMDELTATNYGAGDKVQVTLDGETVKIPFAHGSLNSIRSLLETLALEKQKILFTLRVDGVPASLSQPSADQPEFSRVDAESIPLGELPLLLLTSAQQQADRLRADLENALTLVLINDQPAAREIWWGIARQLKEPILTLSLMPDSVCKLCSTVSFERLRKWQLQQIAVIVREVNAVCEAGDNIKISDALERRVLPWLQKLSDLIQLWLQAISASYQLGISYHIA
jgi:hypothetical protein